MLQSLAESNLLLAVALAFQALAAGISAIVLKDALRALRLANEISTSISAVAACEPDGSNSSKSSVEASR